MDWLGCGTAGKAVVQTAPNLQHWPQNSNFLLPSSEMLSARKTAWSCRRGRGWGWAAEDPSLAPSLHRAAALGIAAGEP